MAATISVLGLILSSPPYLRSALRGYPFKKIRTTGNYCHVCDFSTGCDGLVIDGGGVVVGGGTFFLLRSTADNYNYTLKIISYCL